MENTSVEALKARLHKEYNNMTGIVILKNKQIEYEQYFHNCHEQSRFHIYSITKSIVSLLIGICLENGSIASLDQRILDFFPNYEVKKKETAIQSITLKDIMTMRAPYRYKESPLTYLKYFTSKDYLKFSLNQLGGKQPVGTFRYTPLIGPDILSGVVASACGESVLSFAKTNLFDPMGITVERNIQFAGAKEQQAFNSATDISAWVCDPCGLETGGWGLTLSTRDMAKIGQLCLQEGNWEGRQLVSSTYIKDCMSEHSYWEEEHLSYGYLWWVGHDAFMAMGDGGNVIYVNKKEQLVIAMSGMFSKNVKDRIPLIKDIIEPMFANPHK